jgi:hypothetical protein
MPTRVGFDTVRSINDRVVRARPSASDTRFGWRSPGTRHENMLLEY